MKSKLVIRIVLLLVFAVILGFMLFNDFGIIKYLQLRSEVSNLNKRIKSTEDKIKQLNAEIDSLKTSNYKIEKVARERYRMLGEKEQAVEVEKK